jgi:predicted RecB family nuclease
MRSLKSLRICEKGHRYYKSSDCPTCPVCAQEANPTEGFMAGLSAPAQRALAGAGINTLQQLAKKSEADVLALHGMGPASIPKLRKVLADAGLTFTMKATQPIKKVHR